MKVYRVQDADGRGPFKPGFSKTWVDEIFHPEVKEHPTWMQEFGTDLIARKGRKGEYFGSAVLYLGKLREWFSPTERQKLKELGYYIAAMNAERLLAWSPAQVVFARSLPLNRSVTKISWENITRNITAEAEL